MTAGGSRRTSRLSRAGRFDLKRLSALSSDGALPPRSHIIPGGEYIGSPFYLTSRLIGGEVVRLDHGMRVVRESARKGLREDEREAISSSAFVSIAIQFSFKACFPLSEPWGRGST